MRFSQFDRLVISTLIALAALVGMVVAIGNRRGMPAPILARGGGAVGVNGPVEIVFDRPVDAQSAAVSIHIEPDVEGTFRWADPRRLQFAPDLALDPRQAYRVRIDAGLASKDGFALRNTVFLPVTVRTPELLYLSPAASPELWRASLDGSKKALTHSQGSIYDFSPAPDGMGVVYSVRNEQTGIDLRLVDREGASDRVLLACGADECSNPAWSPDGARLAFTRRSKGAPLGARIWLYDVGTEKAIALYADPKITGRNPNWSPDGQRLAFYDENEHGIRITSFQGDDDLLVASNQGQPGSWSPDGKALIYLDGVFSSTGLFYIDAFSLNITTREIDRMAFTEAQVDRSLPAWSPDGRWLAVGQRPLTGSVSKQIELVNVDGTKTLAVTQDESYTHAAYRWDPQGQRLVYQRYGLNQVQSVPEIVVWSLASSTANVVAQDAALPAWLP